MLTVTVPKLLVACRSYRCDEIDCQKPTRGDWQKRFWRLESFDLLGLFERGSMYLKLILLVIILSCIACNNKSRFEWKEHYRRPIKNPAEATQGGLAKGNYDGQGDGGFLSYQLSTSTLTQFMSVPKLLEIEHLIEMLNPSRSGRKWKCYSRLRKASVEACEERTTKYPLFPIFSSSSRLLSSLKASST